MEGAVAAKNNRIAGLEAGENFDSTVGAIAHLHRPLFDSCLFALALHDENGGWVVWRRLIFFRLAGFQGGVGNHDAGLLGLGEADSGQQATADAFSGVGEGDFNGDEAGGGVGGGGNLGDATNEGLIREGIEPDFGGLPEAQGAQFQFGDLDDDFGLGEVSQTQYLAARLGQVAGFGDAAEDGAIYRGSKDGERAAAFLLIHQGLLSGDTALGGGNGLLTGADLVLGRVENTLGSGSAGAGGFGLLGGDSAISEKLIQACPIGVGLLQFEACPFCLDPGVVYFGLEASHFRLAGSDFGLGFDNGGGQEAIVQSGHGLTTAHRVTHVHGDI